MNSHTRPALFALTLILCLDSPDSRALDYIESSGGLVPPELEAGKTEIEFADVNGDGHVDMVSIGDHGSPFVNTSEHGIMVWLGDGAGAWACHQTGDFGYGGIAIGDVNGDGLWDAAYGMHHNYAAGDLGDQLIEAALGDGTGLAWLPWDDGLATAGEDYGMFYTDLGDIDNDGRLDLASLSFGCCSGAHVYTNRGDGSWSHVWGFLGGNAGDGILFGDIDADGDLDIAMAHQSGTVYLGDGEGAFTASDGNLPAGGTTGRTALSLGDIDADGDLDIAYRGSGASLQVWKWNGDGTWGSASAGLPTSGIAATQLCDMDGDGWIDVIALGNGLLRVWRGDGGTSWTLVYSHQFASPGYFAALRAGGDVDHNGRPDLAVITEEGSWPNTRNTFHVLRETTPREDLAARFITPRGGEAWVGGSVRFVDWGVSVPPGETATVAIDLSVDGPGGPWSTIAEDLPDGGRAQIRVPVVTVTENALLRLRVSVSGGGETIATMPRAFTILPPVSAGLDPPASAPGPFTTSPNPSRGAVRIVALVGASGAPLEVVDAGGRILRTLPPGTTVWDGKDDAGRDIRGGVYWIRRGPDVQSIVRVR